MKRMKTLWLAAVAAGLVLGAGAAQADPRGCDRECLDGMLDTYMDALVARDPSRLPLAQNVRFTENGQELQLGEALWYGVSGATDYRIYMSDPAAGQAALHSVVQENGLPVFFTLRLEVEAGLITEVETLVVRSSSVFEPTRLATPRPALLEILPPDQRTSREDMIRAADLYLDGLEQNTGSFVPFAPECERLENGVVTSAGSQTMGYQYEVGPEGECMAQFNTGIFTWITHITPRRYMVVDEERCLVFGFIIFNHRGNVTQATMPDGTLVDLPPAALRPQSTLAAEIFRIEQGRIHEIEAVMIGLPYGSSTGW